MELAWIPGELPTLYASPPAPWAIPNLSALPIFPPPAVGWSTTPDLGANWSCTVGGEWCVGGVPGNPALDTPSQGTAAPSIQAVVTLNLTSDANLSFLLAGLLDNNTTVENGHLGVNGYFVDITDQLPTLGLNPVVLSVLANSSQPDSGVFGAPCSVCVPALPGAAALRALGLHPHGLFSFISGLWNSFSGVLAEVLTHLSTLVHELVGIVWNGLIAAEMFFAHLPQGLAHYAMVVVHGAVSGLKTVGGILLHGLQVIVAFVEKEVTAFIDSVLAPLKNDVVALTADYALPLGNALCNGCSGADPSVGNALFGGVFLSILSASAVVAIVAEVILTILTGVTLGLSQIVLFALPLIITLLFQAVAGGPSQGPPSVGPQSSIGFSFWQYGVALTGQALNSTENVTGKHLNQTDTSTIESVLGILQSGAEMFGAFMAWLAIVGIAGVGVPAVLSAVYLEMAVASFIIFLFVSLTTISQFEIGHIWGKALGFVGAIMDFFALGGLLLFQLRNPGKMTVATPGERGLLAMAYGFTSIGVAAGIGIALS